MSSHATASGQPVESTVWPDLVAVLALVGLGIAFFWKMTFTGLILPRGDTFAYFYPYWDYRNAIMRAGRLPLWNPYLFMGVPLLANSQAGVLYPLNWPLIGLDAPVAVKAAIISHIVWAAVGMYVFARRTLSLRVLGAILAAAVFALGGYLTAQVEHVNQLQGLAWLPWLFWFWSEATAGRPRMVLWLAIGMATQLLAGHTQSAFISGIGLGAWAVWQTIFPASAGGANWKARGWPLLALALAALFALGLAAAQILPTLELTRLSNRSGGLTALEAVSFSFRPFLIGRGLLPSYTDGEPLFSEYVAYGGIVALVLAWPGAFLRWRDRRTTGLVMLAGLGLFLALGAYNPFYWVLVRLVPGFDLFRAPARWLALWGFALAGLAGIGLDALASRLPRSVTRGRRLATTAGPAALVIALAALSFLAPLEAADVPGATRPQAVELIVWAVTLLLTLGLIVWLWQGGETARRFGASALAALAVIELFLAGQGLPYNDLSAPAAWHSQRPAISTLLAAGEGETPPARFLSISDILFDPGDLREIEALYGPYLDEDALFDYIVATKQKEILAPNLPLAWRIPAMDGFDGGILPTREYIRFTALFLDEEAVSPDGRLRENLDDVPDLRWLQLANVRWIITDKVFDAWIDGIYYDLQFPARLQAGSTDPATSSSIGAYPLRPFEATTVGIVAHLEGAEGLPEDAQIGSVAVFYEGADLPLVQPLLLNGDLSGGTVERPTRLLVRWPQAIRIERVAVSVRDDFPGTLVVRGVSLIDERSGAFVPTSLSHGNVIRLALSGDVKIYEYTGTLPRAYLVCDPEIVADEDEMWERLAGAPGEAVIVQKGSRPPALSDCSPEEPGEATITLYEPERVVVSVEAEGEGLYLILSDAWYPGWEATVDGQHAEVLRASGLFRAVHVPEGSHEVTFTYRSRPFETGAAISGVCVLGALAGLLIRWPARRRSADRPTTPR